MTYDSFACRRRQQPPKRDYDDDNYNYNWMDVVNNSPAKFQPIKKEIPTTEELLKSGLCSKNTCKEEAKNEETGEKNEKKTTRKYNYLSIPFCGYQSITEFAKANSMSVQKARDRRAALIARGMKAEDITADDIINFVSMRGGYRRPKSAASFPQNVENSKQASCQQNVDNSKLDTSAIKQAVQQEGEFKGAEDKAEEKLGEITQFENKEKPKKFTTDDYLDKLGQKYNESRIGDLEVEVKQLRKDLDNIKAMMAKLVKCEFIGAGDVKCRNAIINIIKEIIADTYAK